VSRLDVEEIRALLPTTPRRIADITKGYEEAELQTAPAPGEWSANEVLAHLRACADVWGDCIATILGEDEPTIRAINPRTWIKRTDYRDQEFRRSLRAFTAQRTRLLKLLDPLAPGAWSRSSTVVGAGVPLRRTVRDYAHWMAKHERPHIKQIENTVLAVRG
jgi:hypothetical protein